MSRRYARVCEVCERTEVTEADRLPPGWRRVEIGSYFDSRSAEACSLECGEVLLAQFWTQPRDR